MSVIIFNTTLKRFYVDSGTGFKTTPRRGKATVFKTEAAARSWLRKEWLIHTSITISPIKISPAS